MLIWPVFSPGLDHHPIMMCPDWFNRDALFVGDFADCLRRSDSQTYAAFLRVRPNSDCNRYPLDQIAFSAVAHMAKSDDI